LRTALAATADDVDLMQAITAAVVSVNRCGADDVTELRMRINLLSSVPALHASAASHYAAWERAAGEFCAGRLDCPATR
jgi:hypothetical protein